MSALGISAEFFPMNERDLDGVAALLLIPYLLWVCYAVALNLGIVMLN